MADLGSPSGRPPARSLPEALVRTLRHEVGDLLQKVYASVAILKSRLPADREMEHGVLTRLGSRAEACRRVLDTAHDFVCAVDLECQPVDLAALAEQAVAAARQRFPHLELVTETSGQTRAVVDLRRAGQVAELLLTNAGEAAARRVVFRTAANPQTGQVEWAVTDDGPGIAPELAERLFTPFFTTRAGHSGLGLALARKLVQLHGGHIRAGNAPGGGFAAVAAFPVEPAPGRD